MKNRITELENILLDQKSKYYLGEKCISDKEYDKLEEELATLNPSSPVLSTVGFKSFGTKSKHKRPILSLEKFKTADELMKWIGNKEVCMSYKLDGSNIDLTFSKTCLLKAVTRGDGFEGDDVTENFLFIKMKRTIDVHNEIRINGEVCITEENFALLSDEMVRRNLPKPESIRNIVAGLLHRKEHKDLCRYLTFLPHGYHASDIFFRTDEQMFVFFEAQGWKTPFVNYRNFKNVAELQKVLDKHAELINESEFLCDGLVFSVNDSKAQLDMGSTAHHPKGKVAFKYQAESAETKIIDIDIRTNRTGKVSFTGIVEPVELSGAKVNRVTFHNANYIQIHNINIGATIEICRSNEVIPKHKRTINTNGTFTLPTKCSSCGSTLVWTETDKDLMCENFYCDAKKIQQIVHFTNVLNMKNINEQTINKLYEAGAISSISDLYRLNENDLLSIEGFKERSAQRVIDGINDCREINIVKFLASIGIAGVGESVAELICSNVLNTVEDFNKIQCAKLIKLDGIGNVLATNINNVLLSEKMAELIEELKGLGVTIKHYLSVEKTDNLTLDGLTVVFTGSLSKPRKTVELMVKEAGGLIGSSVNKNTSYLVTDDPNSGSSKNRDAKKNGVKIISEQELYVIMGHQEEKPKSENLSLWEE